MKNLNKTRIIKYTGVGIAIPLTLCALLVLVLALTEFSPQPSVPIPISPPKTPATMPTQGRSIRIACWNIGYGGLGAKQDFFMDGGAMVRPAAQSDIVENLNGITSVLDTLNADIRLLQEVDEYASRSYYVNQLKLFSKEGSMGYAFAYNFKCLFVPFPFPPIGRIASGLATYSSYSVSSATRESLPVPFSWPVRLANLKRCLLVTRLPLASGKTLVIVNLHMEAFDTGAGKIAQTKTLMQFLTSEYRKGNYVIAGGDFNQTFPHHNTLKYLLQQNKWKPGTLSREMLPPGWQYAADENTPTCRSTHTPYLPALNNEKLKEAWQYYLIDGFIVSPNIKIQSVKTIDANFQYSDHNPVVIEIIPGE